MTTLTPMEWIEQDRTLELTERNICALLLTLDDPLSARTLASGCGRVMVRAVEDAARTDAAARAAAIEGIVALTKSELYRLGGQPGRR